MRKILLLMHVSLDGFVCGPQGEMDWIKLSNDLWDYVDEVTASSDTALYGEVTFRMMESYWPTAAEKPNASKHDIDHATWVNNADKIVFSKTLKHVDWAGTRIISQNIAEEMQKLKSLPGKNLLMLGSPTLAHSFMELGLIDEFYINVNPIVLGPGKPLFKDVAQRIPLKLLGSKTFSTQVVGLHYEVVK